MTPSVQKADASPLVQVHQVGAVVASWGIIGEDDEFLLFCFTASGPGLTSTICGDLQSRVCQGFLTLGHIWECFFFHGWSIFLLLLSNQYKQRK